MTRALNVSYVNMYEALFRYRLRRGQNNIVKRYDRVLLKMMTLISFHVNMCNLCRGWRPGVKEILRRRYLVGLVGVATLVNRQEAGNY